MAIPRTRRELTGLVTSSFAKLRTELESGGASLGDLRCIDDWTVKDLLVVRAWWTRSVVDWVEAGRRGQSPIVPAKGYTWRETPRLNAALVRAGRTRSYRAVRADLDRGVARVLSTIERLEDPELLDVGVYPWAGKWPVSRWISVNTARQYATARAFIRRAERRPGHPS